MGYFKFNIFRLNCSRSSLLCFNNYLGSPSQSFYFFNALPTKSLTFFNKGKNSRHWNDTEIFLKIFLRKIDMVLVVLNISKIQKRVGGLKIRHGIFAILIIFKTHMQ